MRSHFSLSAQSLPNKKTNRYVIRKKTLKIGVIWDKQSIYYCFSLDTQFVAQNFQTIPQIVGIEHPPPLHQSRFCSRLLQIYFRIFIYLHFLKIYLNTRGCGSLPGLTITLKVICVTINIETHQTTKKLISTFSPFLIENLMRNSMRSFEALKMILRKFVAILAKTVSI